LFRLRLWRLDEIVAALETTGFQDATATGDYGAAAVAEAEVWTLDAVAG
jgi:hypothetical protein